MKHNQNQTITFAHYVRRMAGFMGGERVNGLEHHLKKVKSRWTIAVYMLLAILPIASMFMFLGTVGKTFLEEWLMTTIPIEFFALPGGLFIIAVANPFLRRDKELSAHADGNSYQRQGQALGGSAPRLPPF